MTTDPITLAARDVAAKLTPLEREWLTGWQGPGGAAFNAIGEGMAERGLTISYTNWNLSPLGLAVRALLKGDDHDND